MFTTMIMIHLVFQAEVGSGVSYRSDIALDDIIVKEGNCPVPTPPPTPNPCLRKCRDGKCVSSDKVCDFNPDCAQGSDNTDDSDEHGCDGCDFENGLCSWNDTSKGIFKWNKQQGRTGSYGTGPSKDHTKGSARGYYAYVEASTGSNYDLASFASPSIKQSSATCMLSFWYHMNGRDIGELDVYVVHGYRYTKLWTLAGSQGNKWKQGEVRINRQQKPFRIEFIATRATSYRGDIAIDDITLEKCALPKPDRYCNDRYSFQCVKTRACIEYDKVCDYTDDCGDGSDEDNCNRRFYPYRCDFEWGLCMWEDLADDDFDFSRVKGLTDTTGTGPMIDHTTATASGYYLYAEASYPRRKGDKARIGSGILSATAFYGCRIRFYYHMTGYHIGKLRLKTRQCSGCDGDVQWERELADGNYWIRESVILDSDKPFQVVFEAEIGGGISGDIALDDISFYGCNPYYNDLPPVIPTPPPVTTTNPCVGPQLYCAADAKCISIQLACDHRNDCSDGEDEKGCGSCNFDNDMCGYTDRSPAEIKWKRSQPSTDPGYLGPRADSNNNAMYFGMTKSLSTLKSNKAKEAVLRSKPLPPTAPNCKLQFSYFYNVTTSFYNTSLLIQVVEDTGNETIYSTILQELLRRSPQWKTVRMGLGYRKQDWQLWFKTYHEYVAIDNITLVDCAFPYKTGVCNFLQVGCDNGACIDQDEVCDFSNNCGDWSDEKPAICSSTHKERCNFETDLCNWYQDRDDDFDWTRVQGPTNSYQTGPGIDHTTGTKKGFYMFIETSWPRKADDIARLLSPIFKPTTSCTMRFFYHMYGSHVDTLRVSLKTSDNVASTMKVLWKKSGNQGNVWLSDFAFINSGGKNFQVAIEGQRGLSYRGDIAIDDISFAGDCIVDDFATLNPQPVTPSPPPGCQSGEFSCNDGQQCIPADLVCNFHKDCNNGYDESFCPDSCDFENNNFCKWRNAYFSDILNWEIHQGKAPSNGTGPTTDHTTNNGTGRYIYMQPSNTKANAPNAHLVSPMYYSGARNCKFTYWYNMWHFERKSHFSDVRLNIYYRRDGRDTLLQSRGGATGNKWMKSTVKLPPCPKDFRLILEGQGFWKAKTDAAIDDWSFDCAETVNPQCNTQTQFTCTKTRQCISLDDVCDNERNCCDGSDEEMAVLCKGYKKYDWQNGLSGWAQLSNDATDFILYSGRTPSWFTGPTVDHTTGEIHGRYLYIEATGQSSNDTAMLASPTIAATRNNPCKMTFWYHMRGTNIGMLTVYTATTYGVKESKIWSLLGNQRNSWKKASVQLSSTSDFQLIFEASVGSAFRGDIAIDDVVLNQGCVLNGNILPGGPTPPPIDPCLPKFQCVNSGVCIPRHQVCDFVEDCEGGTDESYAVCGAPQSFHKELSPWRDSFDVAYHFSMRKGKAPAGQTGPADGDATGNKNGYYAYLDSSNRMRSHKARLMTPVYGGAYSDCVMEFYYHMYSRNIGILEVDLLTLSGNATKLFELKGSQGDKWMKSQVYIGRRKEPFYLNFTASVGGTQAIAGSFGDIAIDEISFKNCGHAPTCSGNLTGKFICANARCIPADKVCDLTDDCGDSSDETTACTNYLGCSFEDHDFDPCNMTQLKGDDFDWTYSFGYTTSYNTGPTRDHTLGTNKGHYYYIEASDPRKKGDKALMATLPITAREGGTCELRFYYHMFGKHVDSLNVYTMKENSKTMQQKFKATGDYGDMWRMAIVDLSKETEKFRLVFEGIVGKSFTSDIAIDDIILTPDCGTNGTRLFPTPPQCTSQQFTCRTSGQCISSFLKCDGNKDCKDGSDEVQGCNGGSTGKSTGGIDKSVSVMAASVVGGIIVLLIIVIVVFVIVKRKREKKLHLFSVFYDPTKDQTPSKVSKGKEKAGVSIKHEGLSNPIYDDQPIGEFSIGDLDAEMFPDSTFSGENSTKGGATSMANPLYQDPYMEDDDSPLSNF